mgnify:CR=1 FL=1
MRGRAALVRDLRHLRAGELHEDFGEQVRIAAGSGRGAKSILPRIGLEQRDELLHVVDAQRRDARPGPASTLAVWVMGCKGRSAVSNVHGLVTSAGLPTCELAR